MKKSISFLLIIIYLTSVAYALEFDTSIDETIRKSYNLSTSESELPALPKVVPTDTPEISQEISSNSATGKRYVIKKGTKITLVSKNTISDRLSKGSKVGFYCKNGFTTKENAIIPAGTVLKATVMDSHKPQLTGNGGLVELAINEIYYNGVKSKIETKLSKANSKKVYMSNIKGKRSYWKNFIKVTNPGRKFFGATQTAATAMSAIPIINLVSFIPIFGGAVVYTVNMITAPVISIFTKGGSVSIPAGSVFEVKISEDISING